MNARRILRCLLAAAVAAWLGGATGRSPSRAAQPTPAAKPFPDVFQTVFQFVATPPLGKSLKAALYPHCPEGTKKLWDILSNAPPPRMFSAGQSRFGWTWLASRHNGDGHGRVSRREFRGPSEWFDRLDRDGDGLLTDADFDWSERSPFVQQTMTAAGLLAKMDQNSNGRVTAEEWADFFAKAASGKGYLSQEDLQTLIFPARPTQPPTYGLERQVQRLVAFCRGESGHLFGDAPPVGSKAPDFLLWTEDGKRQVGLAQFRGQRPVVLVFGSFT